LHCLSYLKKIYGLKKYFFQDVFAKSRFWTFIFVLFSKSQKSLGKKSQLFNIINFQSNLNIFFATFRNFFATFRNFLQLSQLFCNFFATFSFVFVRILCLDVDKIMTYLHGRIIFNAHKSQLNCLEILEICLFVIFVRKKSQLFHL
jgi:hypothetical protein